MHTQAVALGFPNLPAYLTDRHGAGATVSKISVELGCGPAADRALARLGTVSGEPLGPADATRPADEGPLVGAAQQVLCVAGYPVPQDGVFGAEMEAAVRTFQTDHNAATQDEPLVVSGTLDDQTRRALEAGARVRLGM